LNRRAGDRRKGTERREDHPDAAQAKADPDTLSSDAHGAVGDVLHFADAIEGIDEHNDVRGFRCDAAAVRGERDRDVGTRQSRGVVDAVADHHDRRAVAPQLLDEARLIGGREITVRLGNANALGDLLRDRRVIAGQQHEARHARRAKLLQRLEQVRSDFVRKLEHGREAMVDHDIGAQRRIVTFQLRDDIRRIGGLGVRIRASADRNGMAIDHAFHSFARSLHNVRGMRQGLVCFDGVHEHSRQQMARPLFDRGGISEHEVAIEAIGHADDVESWLADRQRTCFVERGDVDRVKRFERAAVANDDESLRCSIDAADDCDRRREDERTRRGDDENRKRANPVTADRDGDDAQADGDRCKPHCIAVGESLQRGFAGLRGAHELDDSRVLAALGGCGRAHGE